MPSSCAYLLPKLPNFLTEFAEQKTWTTYRLSEANHNILKSSIDLQRVHKKSPERQQTLKKLVPNADVWKNIMFSDFVLDPLFRYILRISPKGSDGQMRRNFDLFWPQSHPPSYSISVCDV